MIALKSRREIEIMRQGARILNAAFKEIKRLVSPGVSTAELDRLAGEIINSSGAKAAFKGYKGFPANICASINEEVVHGIPSRRKLKEGDIIGVDVGVLYNGYYTDAARTWPVGKVSDKALSLIRTTEDALLCYGLREARAGKSLGDISNAIQKFVEAKGYSVVRDYVGHGIGREMHEEPQVPNFGKPGTGRRLEAGMALAIEPMVNSGSWQVKVLDNGWTVVTDDGELSAHYEDTIIITDGEPENITNLE
ncbi:MAG: type I methionyl aminopeptidase [Candidatus Omnitrophica bacterium]|nr:type I methionyl aminopeptidase [Candidatus Omnitrophota bacterium]